jgi:cobalamin biosynthesis Mg chelatase CobN
MRRHASSWRRHAAGTTTWARPTNCARCWRRWTARHIPTSYGGDPIKNPDALPTGRNLYGFDPSRVPTKAAWQAGKQALDQLLAAHRAKTGRVPAKLAFTLWSVETMRHFGLLEAQALWALGVEPVWDAGGRVSGVKRIPRDSWAGRAWTWCCRPPGCTATTSPT